MLNLFFMINFSTKLARNALQKKDKKSAFWNYIKKHKFYNSLFNSLISKKYVVFI